MEPITKTSSALALISATNLWERFGFYMMRSILVLYMAKVLLFSTEETYGIFATFSALLYMTPQIGGYLADQFFGRKQMISLGGILLAVGYFLLAIPGLSYFYFGLSTIIVGSGFFVPNIPGILGELYRQNEAKREAAFSILYSAINVGALIPPLISAGLISKLGWHTAFAIAGLGVLLGVLIFNIGLAKISQLKEIKNPVIAPKTSLLIPAVLLGIFILSSLIKHPHLTNIFLFSSGSCLIIYIINKSFKFPYQVRNRLIVSFILTTFSIFFWALYAQGAMSLTLFAEYNVQRQTHWGMIPTMMFLALSPLYIIILGPLFAKIWLWLESKNLNPSIPVKFSLATIFMGLGFAVLPFAIWIQSTTGPIHFGWIVFSYLLQSIGELLISPIGLGMMTTLAPKQMLGLMVGIWYFAMAIANTLGGFISSATVSKDIAEPLFSVMHTFEMVGLGAILAGLVILMLAPYLKTRTSEKFSDSEEFLTAKT